jgi:regulator of RNase E activity RraA
MVAWGKPVPSELDELPATAEVPLDGTFDMVAGVMRTSEMSTCTIADVLDGLGVANCVLDSSLQRVSGGTHAFFGAVVPVSWVATRKGPRITAASPSTWAEVRDFLLPEVRDGRGRVYVAGAGPIVRDAALAGGLSATYLIDHLGFEGMVLGGAMRDRRVVEENELPVVASNFVPTDTQGAYRVAATNSSCFINNVLIQAGDWLFSDGNGSVVVPAAMLDDVLSMATVVQRDEQRVMQRIRAGERLPTIIDEVGRI